jgi:cytochrome c2
MGPKAYVAVLVFALFAGSAEAAAIDPNMGGPGNPGHGEILFKQRCSVCHQPDPGGKNGVGPALYGAYGRRAGQAPGFPYSENLKASGIVWNAQLLNQWIQKPDSLVPNAKMKLAPVSQPQDRADIIAFLRTRTSTPGAAPAAKATVKPAAKPAQHTAKHAARSTRS